MSVEDKKGWDYYKEIKKYKTYSLNPLYNLRLLLLWLSNFLVNLSKTDYMRAFALGCLHTLIFAPFNLLPVIFITFSGLLYLIGRSHARSTALRIGWWFGFGHYLSSLEWIHNALLVESEKFAIMIPFVLLILPALLAFYFVFVAWLTYSVRSNKLNRLLVFASAVTISEIVRTYFYLPFPWNLTGHSVAHYDYFLQLSFYVGVFGLTFLLSFAGGIFYLRSRRAAVACVMAMVFFSFFGIARIELSEDPQNINSYSVRLVQPYNDHHLGEEVRKRDSVQNLLALSIMNRPEDLKYIIWAESAFPYGFYEGSKYIKPLANIVPKDGMLIFGADRVDFKGGGDDSFDIYNSLIGIDDNAQTMFTYDKSILVPFGEYIPFKWLLSKMSKVVGTIYDFSVGPGEAVVNAGELPSFTPFICYETIFPFWGDGASEILLDVTNNIWFGDSIGPHQHFAMVKFKAAEVGKPMVRVANNGVSAVINKYGMTVDKINLNDKGFKDVYIPGGKFDVSFYILKIFIPVIQFFIIFFVFYFEKRKELL